MKKVNSVCDTAKSVAAATKWSVNTAREAMQGAFDMTVKPIAYSLESRVDALTFGALKRWKAKRVLAARGKAMVEGYEQILDLPSLASKRMAEIRAAREEMENPERENDD